MTLRELAEAIKGLSPPERLRLAAELLEQRQAEMAYLIVRAVAGELSLVLRAHSSGSSGG
jgi:hypothetical protein